MQTDISQFRVLLQKFLTQLELESHNFYDYFCINYTPRVQEWATCYRIGAPVNTNMFVEAFRRVLKIIYLQHKQNRRLDLLLNTLIKVARDKIFERLLKCERGKQTHRIREINKRYKNAIELSLKSSGHIIEEDKWKVTLQTNPAMF